jgi:hypothetical protein
MTMPYRTVAAVLAPKPPEPQPPIGCQHPDFNLTWSLK